jgi:phosphatidylglycerol lysyltransferase
VVGYVDAAGYRVAAGAPVCPPERLLACAAAFEEDARRAGRRVCYFGAQDRLLAEVAERSAWLQVGAQPAWDPAGWPASVDGHASLRAQLARARNKGVSIEPGAAGAGTAELRRCLTEWLAGRGLPPMRFLVEPDILGDLRDRLLLVARRSGAAVGFLIASPIPLRSGWLVEQIIRGRAAPNGTAELLLDGAMRALGGAGAAYVTLGLAPLAMRGAARDHGVPLLTRALLRWTRAHGRRFYNFDGLERFKAKFHPDVWEPVYAISREERFGLRALYAIAAAFGGAPPPVFLARALARAAVQEARWAYAQLAAASRVL